MSLPSFLTPHLPDFRATPTPYFNAIFHHRKLSASAHSQWWPPRRQVAPETIIFFIPGNPGLLDFYTPFLNAIYEKDTTSKLAIFGHSHLGHTPGVWYKTPTSCYKLAAQIESILEAFDAIRHEYVNAKVVVIGHSVGSWLSLQVLKARPIAVAAVFLLFPTISRIASTPNGRRLSWLFSPYLSKPIMWLSYLTRLITTHTLACLFYEWPVTQIRVLQAFLRSSSSIHAALGMAHDEMQRICDADIELLEENRDKLWYYFADHDDWVGEEKYNIICSLKLDSNIARVVHGHHEIPHAFCINHAENLAEQCHSWLWVS
ncbi:hypothetical protein BDZ94DRAFT_1273470 [Collybia nuda]|uniref:Lipid droplet-associated hydrolase n=1 Tax=Collybia nuda TaxID=64659 RepID=A0A9P5XV25_9AGAR|nr:hypothetical protein BDZ94DRAFT_1273470 [Collybia nuda]